MATGRWRYSKWTKKRLRSPLVLDSGSFGSCLLASATHQRPLRDSWNWCFVAGHGRLGWCSWKSRFRCAGLKLSPKKRNLFRWEVAYLRHVISDNSVATDPTKKAAIDEWPVLNTTKDVRRYIGLCTYYRRF